MNATARAGAPLQREHEHRIREDGLARLAACACCNPSLIDRFARVLRGTPAAC